MSRFMKDFEILILLYVVMAHSGCTHKIWVVEAVQAPRPFQKEEEVNNVATFRGRKQFGIAGPWPRAQDSHSTDTAWSSLKDHTPLVSTSNSISRTRKNIIKSTKKKNKEQIEAIEVDYKRMDESIKYLQNKLGDLKETHLEALKNRILQRLAELNQHHRSMLLFVQLRMYELSGAGQSMLEARFPQKSHRKITKTSDPITETNWNLNEKCEPTGFLTSSSFFRNAGVRETQKHLDTFQVQPVSEGAQTLMLNSPSVLPTDTVREADDLDNIPTKGVDNQVTIHGDILRFIWDKVMEGVPNMNAILRCTPEEDVFLSRKGLEIKILFEQCVLEAKQFEYKYNLINESQLNYFFMAHDNLELTVLHIYNLFYMDRFGFRYHHTFVPDMKFLCNHWYTEHLHEMLTGLSKHQQGLIIHKAILLTIKRFEKLFQREQSTRSCRIHEFFMNKRFNFALDKVARRGLSLSEIRDEDNVFLKEAIGTMIEYYQRPNPLKQNPHPSEKIEYLINHYILSYLKNYYDRVSLRNLVEAKDSINYDLFERQFEFLHSGLEVHQLLNLVLDCSYIPVYYFKDEEISRSGSFKKKEKELNAKLVTCLNKFNRLKNEMNIISLENSQMKDWMSRTGFDDIESQNVSQAILKFLNSIPDDPMEYPTHDHRNLWFIKRSRKLSTMDKVVVTIGRWFEKFLLLG